MRDAQKVQVGMVLTIERAAGKLVHLLIPGCPWWALRLSADVIRGHEPLRRLVLGSSRHVALEACA